MTFKGFSVISNSFESHYNIKRKSHFDNTEFTLCLPSPHPIYCQLKQTYRFKPNLKQLTNLYMNPLNVKEMNLSDSSLACIFKFIPSSLMRMKNHSNNKEMSVIEIVFYLT